MIGIIGAMDIEVEGLISAMSNKEEKKISGIVFHSGKIGDKECVVAKCGIGKVNAALCTQTMILEYQPECIINTGIGGATSLETKIGDVVIARAFLKARWSRATPLSPSADGETLYTSQSAGG